jgi:hypothetical protein
MPKRLVYLHILPGSEASLSISSKWTLLADHVVWSWLIHESFQTSAESFDELGTITPMVVSITVILRSIVSMFTVFHSTCSPMRSSPTNKKEMPWNNRK